MSTRTPSFSSAPKEPTQIDSLAGGAKRMTTVRQKIVRAAKDYIKARVKSNKDQKEAATIQKANIEAVRRRKGEEEAKLSSIPEVVVNEDGTVANF